MTSHAGSNAAIADCADRQVETDLSSSNRSPLAERFAVDVVTQTMLSALVCDRPADAFGVAGGGEVIPLVTSDDLAPYAPKGPNRAVRLGRLSSNAESKIAELVAARLHAAYQTDGSSATSSIGALYAVAAEHAAPKTDLILLSDGVNEDTQVDLNRPLQLGEGQRLADRIAVPAIRNQLTTIVGIAQVDASRAVPGPSWPAEINGFNERLCARTRAQRCRFFSVASVSDVLAL